MQKQQHRKYQTREKTFHVFINKKRALHLELHIVRSFLFPPPFTCSNKESLQQEERSGQAGRESLALGLAGKYKNIKEKLQINVTDFIHNVWQKTSNAALHSNQAYYTLNKRIFQENKGWFSNVLSCTIQRHLFMPRFL